MPGHTLTATLNNLTAAFIDLIVPPRCLLCSAELWQSAGLCAACWSQLHFISPPLCDRLGIPMPAGFPLAAPSPAALLRPPPYHRARAVLCYDDHAKHLIHNMKYADRVEGIVPFAAWLARAGADILLNADLIIPVPLHRRRLWRRRFNQSAALAAALARKTGIPTAPDILLRIRPTRPQVGLKANARLKNVEGAFAVNSAKTRYLHGKNIILIDDVITTGATVETCTRTLIDAGARQVDVLALARVVKPDKEFV